MTATTMTAGILPTGLSTRAGVLAPAVALIYFVVVGGTPFGEQLGWLRVINTVLGATFVTIYVFRAPHRADRIDRIALGALLVFGAAAVSSVFPRQALDAFLAAFTFAAILFVARDLVTRHAIAQMAIWAMRLLSAVITIYTAARYLPTYAEWWQVSEGSVLPPIGLPLVARPWGHAYDLALLSTVLLPAWLIGRPRRWMLAALVLLATVHSVVVILLGSRAQWLAIVVASLLIAAGPTARALASGRTAVRLAAFAGAIAGGVLLIAFGGPIVDRVLSGATIGQRVEMWSAAVEAWGQRPISGFGPGSFAWVMQTTDYFNTNSIHPRHPDNALFQLLPEAGLLGVSAAALLVVGIGGALIRSNNHVALWAVAVFILAGIGANPTDFSYHVVIAAVWTAIALPHLDGHTRPAPPRGSVRPVTAIALGVIATAVVATLLAGIRFDAAAHDVHRGELRSARRNLDAAIALDPGMALYVRQRGVASLLLGDPVAAIQDLQRAVELSPSDDLAWRTLAIAFREHGDEDHSNEALREALRLQRSDKSNLLLLAKWQADAGDVQELRTTVAEVALAWPHVIAAPGWDDITLGRFSSREVIRLALERWQQGLKSPEPLRSQPLWLAILGGRMELVGEAASIQGLPQAMAEASTAVGWCEPEAGEVLSAVPPSERRSSAYWGLVMQHAAERGRADPVATRLYEIDSFHAPSSAAINERLNPLRENNERGSVDSWGYDRIVIRWEGTPIDLPSPEAGSDRWLLDPRGARQAMNITSGPGSCVASPLLP